MALLLSRMVRMPKAIRARPPMRAMEREYCCIVTARPFTIKRNITISISAWPAATLGPASQPSLSEELTVARRVGPGAMAPVRPTVRPMEKVMAMVAIDPDSASAA